MTFAKDAAKPLLPGGEKAGMRGFGDREQSRPSNPLTLPSPRRGEGS